LLNQKEGPNNGNSLSKNPEVNPMFNVSEVHFSGSGLVLARFGMVLAILFIIAMAVLLRRLLLMLKRFSLSLSLSEWANGHTEKILVPVSGRTYSEDKRHVH
jgi:hypothetical protein